MAGGRGARDLVDGERSTGETRLQAEGIQVGHLCVPSGTAEDAEQTIAQAKALGATWVVVDGYHFGADYQRVIKKAGLRLLFIDDYGHAAHYWADLVLNSDLAPKKLAVIRNG
ncbi:hypothetical protein [Moorena sp. SIO4G3]|uniref:hypothetical protein n=1 Tax=Moorena sp. SIO4G3 TaxID=2607821 RepID=UPI00142BEB76|nr:hypothetical protein [Moorena sp. SIO4G3]NEO80442.1 hypothetical protein [Moorena sp. SIO4G3]